MGFGRERERGEWVCFFLVGGDMGDLGRGEGRGEGEGFWEERRRGEGGCWRGVFFGEEEGWERGVWRR